MITVVHGGVKEDDVDAVSVSPILARAQRLYVPLSKNSVGSISRSFRSSDRAVPEKVKDFDPFHSAPSPLRTSLFEPC